MKRRERINSLSLYPLTTDCCDNDSVVEDLTIQSEEKRDRMNSLSLYPLTTGCYDNDSMVEDLTVQREEKRENKFPVAVPYDNGLLRQ